MNSQPPPCQACGRPWADHPGIQQLCAEVQALRLELSRRKANNGDRLASDLEELARHIDSLGAQK